MRSDRRKSYFSLTRLTRQEEEAEKRKIEDLASWTAAKPEEEAAKAIKYRWGIPFEVPNLSTQTC